MPPRNTSAAPAPEEANFEEALQPVVHAEEQTAGRSDNGNASASSPVRVYADGERVPEARLLCCCGPCTSVVGLPWHPLVSDPEQAA